MLVPFLTRAADAPVDIQWLGGTPAPVATGVSWGVPWPQGAVKKDRAFALTTADGKTLPLQTWPLAYWPDGSLKWSGFATVAGPEQGASFKLALRDGAEAASTDAPKLTVNSSSSGVEIDTGRVVAKIPTSGPNLIASLAIGGKEIARDGRLVGVLQNGPDNEPDAAPAREKFVSQVEKVTVEQSGPIRAVVRIEGKHRNEKSGRQWLPFSVRLYFYAGQEAIRVVHTIVFDGDQEKDFIHGLGLAFAVPMREQSWNRHVRFSGQDGLWSEPIQPGGGNPAQQAGEKISGGRFYAPDPLEEYAIWSDYKLVQASPDGFTISKRTNPQSTWVSAAAGKRATGLAWVGDVSGGLGISVKNFWQSYPSELEVRGAASEAAQLTAWLWSPDVPAMDLRHYDTRAHGLNATYEDVQAGLSTPFGVARTSELTLYPAGAIPDKKATLALAENGTKLPLLVASPQYIHTTGVFGVWSLPDRSTPLKAAVEDRLDATLAYYEQQQDERSWYGFWYFGDFMHSYSAAAHEWYYDYGGHAWDNTELGAPLWMWYSFLRTGRADLFRLAEAHTRNTSETDVYHMGPMLGLGSRHNVVKWGCGAKEARISQAAHWRPFYYFTTDERTGDIMREQLNSDFSACRYDPMREAQPILPQDPKYPGRVRVGPDWFAFCGNWMTEWERTGDTKWRDKILAGVDSILAMPFWIRSGVRDGLNPDLGKDANGKDRIGPLKGGGSMTAGYDPQTGKLFPIPDPITHTQVPVNYNLSTIQGGAEVMFELVPLLGRDDWAKAWLQYCRLGTAPAEVLTKDRETGNEGADASMVEGAQGGPRLAAYAYAHTKNAAFAQRAFTAFAQRGPGAANPTSLDAVDSIEPAHEARGVSTNDAAQASLTLIEILQLCADQLPTEAPAPQPAPNFQGRGRGARGGRGAPAGGEAAPASPATSK
ncbi:MAG TPA: Tat pathway signal sequence domain protein [Opitutaceae bacterium]|nr:Tat pathway signal sequence domain protein [Opitutaceae bacterium]